MKKFDLAIKPLLRWFIFGLTLFFLIKTFKDNWQEVSNININQQNWFWLGIALLTTLLAHIWSGLVWIKILHRFGNSAALGWSLKVYLTTNIAKYLPGNVWHFGGRIRAVTQKGDSLAVATLSVMLEPLLMAAAALIIAVISNSFGLIDTSSNRFLIVIQTGVLLAVLIGVHPRIINPIIVRLSRSKTKTTTVAKLSSYPLLPLLGEIGFLVWRGSGFIFTLMAITSITWTQIPPLIGAFSWAWLLGLVVPGAPGGLGIFEATAVALLDSSQFPQAQILATVAIFRLISILAEAIAAAAVTTIKTKLI